MSLFLDASVSVQTVVAGEVSRPSMLAALCTLIELPSVMVR